MADDLRLRVAAAILRFLQQHELEKTAKTLLKETSKQDWGLEAAAAEDEQFDLLQLCAAEERRSRGAKTNGCQSGERKLKEVQAADSNEQPRIKKKRRSQQQHETPEADALSTGDETAAAVRAHKKKGHRQLSPNEGEDEEQLEPQQNDSSGQKASKNGGVKRFQRIDDSQWTSALPAELKDNSFWKKKHDNFAVKAAEQLGRVRGKDFRHEKTKKKKATWKGCGEIPMTVNSIQFDSDSE